MTKNKTLLLLYFLSAFALSSCAGYTNQHTQIRSAKTDTKHQKPLTDKTIEKALLDAEKNGNKQEALLLLEQLYTRYPQNPAIATRYSRALQKDNQINAAKRVLEPFIQGENKNAGAITEMAMAELSLGHWDKAAFLAKLAISMTEDNARAYLALGTVQDALGHHKEAESSFRTSLKKWKGDPTPIINNLALNLASQGHLQEALTLLEKAKKISPSRLQLERNRRIISTLLEETTKPQETPAPIPKRKPKTATTAPG